MNPYEQFQTEDRRLTLLLILSQSEGYRCNEFLLQTLLDQRGHMVSLDRLRADAGWLEEQGLVTGTEIAGTGIVELTARGFDVADGRAAVPGIKRRRPGT